MKRSSWLYVAFSLCFFFFLPLEISPACDSVLERNGLISDEEEATDLELNFLNRKNELWDVLFEQEHLLRDQTPCRLEKVAVGMSLYTLFWRGWKSVISCAVWCVLLVPSLGYLIHKSKMQMLRSCKSLQHLTNCFTFILILTPHRTLFCANVLPFTSHLKCEEGDVSVRRISFQLVCKRKG